MTYLGFQQFLSRSSSAVTHYPSRFEVLSILWHFLKRFEHIPLKSIDLLGTQLLFFPRKSVKCRNTAKIRSFLRTVKEFLDDSILLIAVMSEDD